MKYLLVFIVIFNVVMWLVFLRMFRKLFTTENIIEDTKSEYNKLVADFQKNIHQALTVSDEHVKQLKALISEADKKIKLLNDMESKSLGAKVLQESISQAGIGRSPRKKAQESYQRNKGREKVSPDASFSLTEKASTNLSENEERTLFDEENVENTGSIKSATINTKVTMNVQRNGDSWAEIPVITPEVFASEHPITPKKDKKTQIVELYDTGYSIEEISSELNLTDTEVQFALSLENRI
ncbi:MAG: hypothetical protein K6E78_06170 [Treponema sp.]|nr:hypothetical protein [Treponema sp.]